MHVRRATVDDAAAQERHDWLVLVDADDRVLGYCYGGMTSPNLASEALHLAVGFEPAGVMRRVGWKRDAWHDVAFFQRPLATPHPEEPPEDLPSA